MQYLLTKEEYDALRNPAVVKRRKILEEVLTALGEEFSKVVFHKDPFGVGGTIVRLPDMKSAIDRTRNRFV